MKRLQLRHHDEIFESRSLALEFFNNIVDLSHTASTVFGKSLYAEPMVAKYLDSESNVQLLFAIGVDSPNAPYHIIDSKEIYEKLKENEDAILAEEKRAMVAEKLLDDAIKAEIVRATSAETILDLAIKAEVERATSAEAALNQAIEDNKTSIVPIEQSGANVLEEFALKNNLGEVLGSTIKIYKDSSLVGALTGFKGAKSVEKKEDNSFELTYDENTRDESIEYLYLIYRDENGELKLVGIDFENFLMEAEFGDGIKVIDHVAHIKIKEGEKYLSVDKDGIYTVKIDEAINEAITTLSGNVVTEINKVSTEINESITTLSGNVVTEINKVNVALASEKEERIEGDNKLDEKIDTEISDLSAELKAEIKSNKIHSKDVVLKQSETGTTLEIQTDEITITKKADARTIYDTNIAVLGSLLKIKKVDSNNTSIKSRYELQGSDGKLIGDAIELPVESALISVKQGKEGDEIDVTSGNYIKQGEGDTTMNFVYRLDNGTYELAQIVVSEYFTDSHFGKGLNNQDGVVSLKEGDGNEYLVIGEDTISVVGVNASIEKAKNEAIENSVSLANSYTDTVANGINANFETTKNFVISEIETVSSSLGERISDLNNQINSEISTINSRLDEEIINRQNAIDTESQNRQNAIDSVNQNIINSIAIETQNREAALALVKSNLQTDINDVRKLIIDETLSRENEDKNILETLRTEISNAKTESILESTTSAVTTAVSEATKIATEVASESIAKIVDGASSSYDTLKEIADWIINDTTGSAQMANDIQALKVDTNNLKTESSKNTNNINTLTNDVNTLKKDALKVDNDITVINEKITTLSGSVKNTVISSIDEAIIDNGLYITDVKPEDYQSGSLLRKLLYNDKTYFYASSKAEDMTLTNNLGSTVNLRDYVISLQETIKTLNETIENLKEQVKELEENGSGGGSGGSSDSVNEEQVKEIIKDYLQGVKNEIQISESNNKLTIGFADDAIFG